MPVNIVFALKSPFCAPLPGYFLGTAGQMTLFGCLALGLLLCIFIFWFRRDPERSIIAGEGCIVSAADGRVCSLEHICESLYLHSEGISIGIFLSVFDVHITRIPMSGVIRLLSYKPGRFLPAYNREASLRNEQQVIGIESERGKILVKQIAGRIARRIVCRLHVDDVVRTGDRFGMIRFGSRVEVVLPLNTEVIVRLGDRVRAGETILGILK